METNLNRVATDLIDKIGNFSNLEYKDRENQTIPPTMDDQIENARIFNFNFDENGVDFGPVTITISEQDGLQIKMDIVSAFASIFAHGRIEPWQ